MEILILNETINSLEKETINFNVNKWTMENEAIRNQFNTHIYNVSPLIKNIINKSIVKVHIYRNNENIAKLTNKGLYYKNSLVTLVYNLAETSDKISISIYKYKNDKLQKQTTSELYKNLINQVNNLSDEDENKDKIIVMVRILKDM